MDIRHIPENSSLRELVTFHVGETICGLFIQDVQEVNPVGDITSVPQAPPYLKGILNLRGQIITVLDVSEKLGLGKTDENRQNRIVIVKDKGEASGLLVSRMGDVIIVDRSKIEPAPANVGAVQSAFFEGFINEQGSITGILNLERVLAD